MEFQDFPPFYGMHAVDSLSGGLFSSEIGIRTVLPDSFARYMQSIPHVEAWLFMAAEKMMTRDGEAVNKSWWTENFTRNQRILSDKIEKNEKWFLSPVGTENYYINLV